MDLKKGVYLLITELRESMYIEVGKLGVFFFPGGYYVYTGSAMNGVQQRVRRHTGQRKKLRWHIDYLLRYGRVRGIIILSSEDKIECRVNQMVKGLLKGRVIVPGFGSSDCKEKCGSHLLLIEKDGFNQGLLEKLLNQARKKSLLSFS
jgi:Uri superfamily endonuclease